MNSPKVCQTKKWLKFYHKCKKMILMILRNQKLMILLQNF